MKLQDNWFHDVNDAHSKAWESAKKQLPEDEVSLVLSLIHDVLTEKLKPEEAAAKLAKNNEKAFKTYFKVFAEITGEDLIKELLKNAQSEDIRSLSESDFSKRVVKCCEQIQKDVSLYMHQDIDVYELILRIGKTDVMNLVKIFADRAGIDTQNIPDSRELENKLKKVGNVSIQQTAFVASIASYEILMDELDKAHKAHIEDEQIIAQCRESAREIVRYRQEMEQQVNQYLGSYLNVFEKGFGVMDQAIIEGDSNSYLAGNASIQNALGRYVQFWDQKSFDDFMESDVPLKF